MKKPLKKPQLVALLCLPLALELILPPSVRAMDSEDLYRRCRDFPHNSQCQGYEKPVALAQRSGQLGTCTVNVAPTQTEGACKVNLNEEGITLYQEFGGGLSVLQEQKLTKSIKIPINVVNRLQYGETEKFDGVSAALNALTYGNDWASRTTKLQFSDILVNYGATPESSLIMTFERTRGSAISSQLEQLTGKTAALLAPKFAK